MSESPGLLSAMLAVQAAAPTLPKDATNPHFRSKYTPLDTIVEKIGPILNTNGLVWTTLPGRDEHGDPALKYRLCHAPSGEVLEGEMPLLLSKQDAQGQGSAITYARRYALCAVLNLVADDDDDGNEAANGQARAQYGQTRTQPEGGGTASAAQKKLVRTLFTQKHLTPREAKELLGKHGVTVGEGEDPRREPVDRLRWPAVSELIDELKARLPRAEQQTDAPVNLDDFVHGRGDVEGLPID